MILKAPTLRFKVTILLATAAVAVTLGTVASKPATASAEYYWGCTYSWNHVCFASPQLINFLITQDPDHAAGAWGGTPTNNGYKIPKHDGIERCVASAIWRYSQVVPWVSAWGEAVVTYPEWIGGEPMIGSCAEYTNIALYQMVDLSESE